MSEFRGAEVWGSPSDALPVRAVYPEELYPLLNNELVKEVHIPSEGQLFFDGPGPGVRGPEGTVSEFLIELREGDEHVHFRYGYPEVVEGELAVPKDLQLCKMEGIVRWWKNTVDFSGLDDIDILGDSDTTPSLWEMYERSMTPIRSDEGADDECGNPVCPSRRDSE